MSARGEARKITHSGETRSLRWWSKRTGLCRFLIAKRLNRGWSPERALTTPTPPKIAMRRKQRSLVVDGQPRTLVECAQLAGISLGAFVKRLDGEMALDEAISTPPDPTKQAAARARWRAKEETETR